MVVKECETLLEFPCEYDVKAIGYHSNNFDAIVVDIVSRYIDDVKECTASIKHSRSGRFASVTVKIHAISKSQLDAIYRELSRDERVKYVL
ncbi:MAG: DUF493 domain-containing protein [Piscirickettsiaceae bacterium]|nr:DUF493 domain-containing protein [Piscirickettsiaceae bacterium]